MYYYTTYDSIVGMLYLVSKDNKLIGLYIENQKYFLRNIKDITLNNNLEIFIKTKKWLDKYFSGKIVDGNEIPVEFIGTSFQKEVWNILREIPYGEVITYGDISKRLCEKRCFNNMSSQAVGGAVGKNPISIIVPCHRVVGVNHRLVGYAGGIDKKIQFSSLKIYCRRRVWIFPYNSWKPGLHQASFCVIVVAMAA